MFRACVLATVLVLGLATGPMTYAQAPQPAPPGHGCFSRQEQRMAVYQHRAISLGIAMRSIHARDGDELLRAELCRNSSGLVYVLTILSRNGKVSRAVVDARSGAVIRDR